MAAALETISYQTYNSRVGIALVVKRAPCVIAVVCTSGVAQANTVTLDNGIAKATVGHLDVTDDDFGSFGRWIGPNDCDNFYPPNYQRADPLTNVATNYLFITYGANQGGVELSGYLILQRLLEGAQADGIEGNFANLTRTVTTNITAANGIATSAFEIADSASGLKLDVSLTQQLVVETAPATRLEQDYTLTNNSAASVTFVWHAIWDMNCLYADANADTDFVGVGQGNCYTYMHDPGSTTQGGSFTDGGSQIGTPGALNPLSLYGYYGAKQGALPDGNLMPPFNVATSTPATQYVWQQLGMPATWVNRVSDTIFKDQVGETDMPAAPTGVGHEYRFLLAPGEVAVIKLRRHWGTISLPCVSVGANCGNGVVDPGEQCDPPMGVDTADCNHLTCTTPTCGDGVLNTAAGEQCESNRMDSIECNADCTLPACGDGHLNLAAGEACDDGKDTAACNLANCQVPACGDGIVNVAAGEDCESGALCDLATCSYQFSLGGGCAGCGAQGGGGSLALAGLVGALVTRRRRARTA